MSIFEYNGSALVAMVGKNCFAIASDRRLGVQLQTIATDFQRIYKIHDKLYVGLSGLATDAQTLYQRLVFRHKLYQLREERDMKPETFASLVSAILYEKRFVVCYFSAFRFLILLDVREQLQVLKEHKWRLMEKASFAMKTDSCTLIEMSGSNGRMELAKDFVVAGTASESLYGACESMYKPDMLSSLSLSLSPKILFRSQKNCLRLFPKRYYLQLIVIA
ncbi:Proteasome subunit beta type-3-A [Asimina triloba]